MCPLNGVGKEHHEVTLELPSLTSDGRPQTWLLQECGTIANWLFSVKSARRTLVFANQEFVHDLFVQFNSQPGAGRDGNLSVYERRKIGDKLAHQG